MTEIAEIWEWTRKRASEGHLGMSRQFAEMLLLRAWRGVGPGYYHMAGFWRRELPWSTKTGQVSQREYAQVLARLNPVEYRKISQHKLPEKALLTLMGVPTPPFLGLLSTHRGIDVGGRRLSSASDLAELVTRERLGGFVLKALEGHGGKGVLVVDVQSGEEPMVGVRGRSEPTTALTRFFTDQLKVESGTEWLVERIFQQHPAVAALNPSSVNTARVWALASKSGECQVVTAYLRIGRHGMCVDNASSGGIVAPIDLSSGRLHAAQDAAPARTLYPNHPDHGARIEGIVLPTWLQAQEVAMRALSTFPGVRFAGCDVAFGIDGPAVLELNLCPDREGAAFTDFPSKRVLEQAAR